jgi:hypothetical protein
MTKKSLNQTSFLMKVSFCGVHIWSCSYMYFLRLYWLYNLEVALCRFLIKFQNFTESNYLKKVLISHGVSFCTF